MPVAKPEERGLERLILFSDAVVAIAITLLVLPLTDLKPVEGQSALALVRTHWNEIFAFAISFAVIAKFWFSHHRIFRSLVSHDSALLVLNTTWLLSIALMPFTTAVLDGEEGYATLYLINLLLTSLLTVALATYINAHPELQDEVLPAAVVRRNRIGGLTMIAAIVLALIFSLFIEHYALFFLLLIPAFQRVADRAVPDHVAR